MRATRRAANIHRVFEALPVVAQRELVRWDWCRVAGRGSRACYVTAGRGGIHGRPRIASRSTVILFKPFLAALDT